MKYSKINYEQDEEPSQYQSRLISNASQELRTVLSLMLDSVEQFLSESENGQNMDVLSIMKINGERLLDLLGQMTDSLKIERGTMGENIRDTALYHNNSTMFESEDKKFIAGIMAVVEENIDNSDLKVKTISEKLIIPHPQLYRRLKSLTGMSINEFVRTVRINKAAQLLRTTDMNVSEVMYICGFNTSHYFARCFQVQYSMKPSEYIKLYRKKINPEKNFEYNY